MNDIIQSLIIAGITGAVSSFATIKALHVHIFYIREGQEDLENRLNNHSARINALEIKVGK